MGLNREDIDLEAVTLHIQAKGGPPVADERVFLNPQVCGLLRHHLDETATQASCGSDAPVFLSKSDRRLGARQIQLHFAR